MESMKSTVSGGCMSTGIIEHEFIHAIGVYHTQVTLSHRFRQVDQTRGGHNFLRFLSDILDLLVTFFGFIS